VSKYPEFQSLSGYSKWNSNRCEILAYPNNEIGTFNDLQTRIGRLCSVLKSNPILKAYNLWNGRKWHQNSPYEERQKSSRNLLESVKG
jgi:DNA ligase-1